MLKYLQETLKLQRPAWQKDDERFCDLDIRDKFLSSQAYEHLRHNFSEEEEGDGSFIPIYKRRPSVIYPYASSISALVARKTFGGRHAPRLVHEKDEVRQKVERLLQEARYSRLMIQIAKWASVGSVGVTYKILGEGDKGKLIATPWRAKYCTPRYDKMQNLKALRIAYPTCGYEFLARGWDKDVKGDPIVATNNYWRIVDQTKESEKSYVPIYENSWMPSMGDEMLKLNPEDEIRHDLGIVQAQWFTNSTTGSLPDGDCLFGAALPICIDIDFTLSSLGRAIRYNAAPQVVTVGDLIDDIGGDGEGKPKPRSPHMMLRFEAPEKDGTNSTGGGDAHLLEMTGEGIKIGLEYVQFLRKLAQESTAAIVKDPDHAGTLITGAAMDSFDDNFIDLIQDLRSCLGDDGTLQLTRQMCLVAIAAKHPLMEGVSENDIDGLKYQWPKVHELTPQDLQQLVASFVQAITGPTAKGENGLVQMAGWIPLIDPKDARNYIYDNCDFPVASVDYIEDSAKPDGEKDEGETAMDTPDESNVLPPNEKLKKGVIS